jgi:hypothetical protein
MINHPNRRSNPIVALVRASVGRQHKITREQMRDLLAELESRGLVELKNGWCQPRAGTSADYAGGWADMCRDITVISVLDATDPIEPRLRSSNPGEVRYDEPGRMHPLLKASLMFAPESLGEYEYLRRRCRRLLVVTD